MYAIEFEAKVKDGKIEIPAEYRDKFTHVKVIVLTKTTEEPDNLIEQLLESPLQIPGFQPLSRDEIYKRV